MDYQLRGARALQNALRSASPVPDYPEPLLLPVAPRKPNPDLWAIAQAIMTEVGNCIPDCDPIDRLGPLLERMGLDRWSVSTWLDRAAKKHLGVTYDAYLADAWDGWNEICEPDQRMDNPWR